MIKVLAFFALLFSSLQAQFFQFRLVEKIPFDNSIFTQGLVFFDSNLYISGGEYGKSALYKYDLKNKNLEMILTSPQDEFNEGVTIKDDKIYQLTWKKEKGYVFDLKTLKQIENFSYSGEGWGITNNKDQFFMSNGSDEISVFSSSKNIKNSSKFRVEDMEGNYTNLNELEWVEDRVFANVWYKDFILVIDPELGFVEQKFFPKEQILDKDLKDTGVLNGIAYDKTKKYLYVTGKNWHYIFVYKVSK